MLQKLRDKTSGWIVTVILGLLMIPFLFVIDNSYLGGVGAQNVAKVSAPPTWWRSAPSWWPVRMLWQHHEISSQDFRTRFEQDACVSASSRATTSTRARSRAPKTRWPCSIS
jgi:peptidyl-prolyl cis-trans isomerase D